MTCADLRQGASALRARRLDVCRQQQQRIVGQLRQRRAQVRDARCGSRRRRHPGRRSTTARALRGAGPGSSAPRCSAARRCRAGGRGRGSSGRSRSARRRTTRCSARPPAATHRSFPPMRGNNLSMLTPPRRIHPHRRTRTPAKRGRHESPATARPCRSRACPAPAACPHCRRALGCARRKPRCRGSSGFRTTCFTLPFSMTRPRSQPNWNLLRESSIDHDRLVSSSTPRSMPATRSSNVASPGSRLRFAMRSIGGRFQLSARELATPCRLARACEMAPPSGRSRMPARIRCARLAGVPSSSKA